MWEVDSEVDSEVNEVINSVKRVLNSVKRGHKLSKTGPKLSKTVKFSSKTQSNGRVNLNIYNKLYITSLGPETGLCSRPLGSPTRSPERSYVHAGRVPP